MKRSIDHDRFVEKNRSTALSQEYGAKDGPREKKGDGGVAREREPSCYSCKTKRKCPEFRSKQTGGTSGVVSFGGDEKFVCNNYSKADVESRSMSNKQIKSLLKNAMRGLR
jgi:hypothetical protein